MLHSFCWLEYIHNIIHTYCFLVYFAIFIFLLIDPGSTLSRGWQWSSAPRKQAVTAYAEVTIISHPSLSTPQSSHQPADASLQILLQRIGFFFASPLNGMLYTKCAVARLATSNGSRSPQSFPKARASLPDSGVAPSASKNSRFRKLQNCII